ncbi:MAG: DUF2857 domain-containing protein [Azoarcus sp.]|jgi:hypothetical protein|nr:DUF2857 domain-containing protein [Azoarcus sp.]
MHPINQAVLAQALYDLRNGQTRRCKAMGFGENELEALKHPEQVAVLTNAAVTWCSVSVNRDIVTRLLNYRHKLTNEIAVVDRMLRLGASSEMVNALYGLSHQEVALRRGILQLPSRKGRPTLIGAEQEQELYRRWKAGVIESGFWLDDNYAMLALSLELAEAMDIPLASVWQNIQNWIKQGLE